MVFVTASGSTYEINHETKQIRRLKGKEDPTPRQGQDGVWKDFSEVYGMTPAWHPMMGVEGLSQDIILNNPVLIQWANEEPKLKLPGVVAGTMTSPVVEIYPDGVQ